MARTIARLRAFARSCSFATHCSKDPSCDYSIQNFVASIPFVRSFPRNLGRAGPEHRSIFCLVSETPREWSCNQVRTRLPCGTATPGGRHRHWSTTKSAEGAWGSQLDMRAHAYENNGYFRYTRTRGKTRPVNTPCVQAPTTSDRDAEPEPTGLRNRNAINPRQTSREKTETWWWGCRRER